MTPKSAAIKDIKQDPEMGLVLLSPKLQQQLLEILEIDEPIDEN